MRGYETCREVDLPLPIEGIESSDADCLGIGGQIVQPVFGTVVARDAGWRHVKITGEVERHRTVQDAAHGLEGPSWFVVSIRLSIRWTALA